MHLANEAPNGNTAIEDISCSNPFRKFLPPLPPSNGDSMYQNNYFMVLLSDVRLLHGDGEATLVFSKLRHLLQEITDEEDRERFAQNDYWLQYSLRDMQEETGMDEKNQRKAIGTLRRLGLISTAPFDSNPDLIWMRFTLKALRKTGES